MTSEIIGCAVPGCPNPAGPEGYCASHEDLAKLSREDVMATLQMAREAEMMDALRKAARRVINAERSDQWHKATKAKRRSRKAAAKSRSRNR